MFNFICLVQQNRLPSHRILLHSCYLESNHQTIRCVTFFGFSCSVFYYCYCGWRLFLEVRVSFWVEALREVPFQCGPATVDHHHGSRTKRKVLLGYYAIGVEVCKLLSFQMKRKEWICRRKRTKIRGAKWLHLTEAAAWTPSPSWSWYASRSASNLIWSSFSSTSMFGWVGACLKELTLAVLVGIRMVTLRFYSLLHTERTPLHSQYSRLLTASRWTAQLLRKAWKKTIKVGTFPCFFCSISLIRSRFFRFHSYELIRTIGAVINAVPPRFGSRRQPHAHALLQRHVQLYLDWCLAYQPGELKAYIEIHQRFIFSIFRTSSSVWLVVWPKHFAAARSAREFVTKDMTASKRNIYLITIKCIVMLDEGSFMVCSDWNERVPLLTVTAGRSVHVAL